MERDFFMKSSHRTFGHRRTFRLAMVVWSLVLVCSTSALSATDARSKIGVLIDDARHQSNRWQQDVRFMSEWAQQRQATLMVRDGQGSQELQLAQAKELLKSGAQVLILNAHDAKNAAAIVTAASQAGVPTICYDRMVLNSKPALYISFDSLKVGQMQAQYLLSRAPRGNYIVLEGSPSDHNAQLLREGHMKVLEPAIKRGDIKILLDSWVTDWSKSQAYAKVKAALVAHPDITAVVAANDDLAAGALQALQEANTRQRVLISGQDAELGAVVNIIKDQQAMTIYKPLRSLARAAINSAITLATKGTLKTTQTMNNGYGEIPSIVLEPILVDGNSIFSTVVYDGFLSRENLREKVSPEEWEAFQHRRALASSEIHQK